MIVDAIRTPGGKRNGKLKDWHPVDLAAHVLKALQQRNDLDPALVDDVVMGCVMQVGQQSLNIGRNAVLAAGWPESVPATTVDRQCGSSQQALHFAAQGVIAGAYDVVVAAGVEVMTRTPMGSSVVKELGFPFPKSMFDRYAETGLPPQGIGAEMIADEYGFTREDLDAFGAESQRRAAQARTRGGSTTRSCRCRSRSTARTRDDDPRRGDPRGHDGRDAGQPQAGVQGRRQDHRRELVADQRRRVGGADHERREGGAARPAAARAGSTRFAVAGTDPVTMLKGPIPATAKIMQRSGLSLDDIDLFEVNEAFASVVLAWQKEHGTDLAKTNVNGGAIALGHPLGCVGHQADVDVAERARAHRRPLRPADDVRGRRAGQRHDHREGLRCRVST